MSDELEVRVQRFRSELQQAHDRGRRMARWNYRGTYGLVILAVASSAAAGILGLGFKVDQRLVSVLALIPALAVTVAGQLRWQDKANLHYRKFLAAKTHLRLIDCDPPRTQAELADMIRSYAVIESELNDRREGIAWTFAAQQPAARDSGG